jgi:hypothetical protein
VLHRTIARITVALIGAVSAGTAPGCGGSSVGAGESSDDGQPVGVCEGSISKSPAATIRVTRSTNSPELTVAVYCDGSAERTLGEAPPINSIHVMPKTYEPSSPEVVKFLTDLDAVGDVSLIPAPNIDLPSHCAKSVSLGTFTTIVAQGKTSGDMQCIHNPTSEESALAADCRVLAPWP